MLLSILLYSQPTAFENQAARCSEILKCKFTVKSVILISKKYYDKAVEDNIQSWQFLIKEASAVLKTAALCTSTEHHNENLQLALTNTASFTKIGKLKYVHYKVLHALGRDLLVCLSLFTHYN